MGLSRGKRARPLVRSAHRAARHRRFVRQAEPGDAGEEPGDVRGGGRRGAHHRPDVPDARNGRRRASASSCRSPHGCGLPSCSRISRKPWRKAAAKPRPTACARRRPTAEAKKLVANGKVEVVSAASLRKGDVCLCEPNDMIPGDGDVIEGIASVDESVITGESAPVIRESGGDRSAVTGGTKVLSDYIKVQITSNPGETFLDRMIALVEGAQRQKTPNEIALNIMIAGLTLIFLLAVVTLAPFAQYSVDAAKAGTVPIDHRAGLTAGLPDPHHDRRIAFGHRHRGHGSRDAAQRAGHERQGGRSGRRRQHAAARQDRHHHARQSPGGGIHSRRRASTNRNWPTPRSFPASPMKPRKAAASWCWPKRSTGCADAKSPRIRPSSFRLPRRRA